MIARRLLQAFGWKLVYVPPPVPKAVVIFYPHTSNWDFPLGLLARAAVDLDVHWVGKHTLFRGPLGPLMRALGGIAVDRSAPRGLIEQLRHEFESRESFYVAIAPEGTRSRGTHWKSGFYRLALAAGVPVGLGFFDYRRREIGVLDWLPMTGDARADLERIAAAYAGRQGRHPEQATPIGFGEGATVGESMR